MLPNPRDWYADLRLRILPLHVKIRWSRAAFLPPHIVANVLRGAFNITFRRLVCPPEWMNNACPPCPLYEQCPYGRLFEPTPPEDSDRLRRQADLPRPFVLKPPLTNAGVAHDAGDATDSSPPRPRFGGEGPGVRGRSAGGLPIPSGTRAARGSEATSEETLEFGLVLLGTATDHLPHFIVTLAELGRVGMGPQRIPFTIESVTAQSLASSSEAPAEPLYNPATHTFTAPRHIPTTADVVASRLPSPPPRGRGAGGEGDPLDVGVPCVEVSTRPAPSVATSPAAMSSTAAPPSVGQQEATDATRLTLRFLTPTLIRTGSGVDAAGRRIPARELRDRPDFGTLARRLRDRLSTLCYFFGEAPWTGVDFAQLGHLADTVQLIHSETNWQHRSRYSTKSGETHEISGLTGSATYQFESPEHKNLFLPLLQCGEYLHIGKHAVWGNGWVEVHS